MTAKSLGSRLVRGLVLIAITGSSALAQTAPRAVSLGFGGGFSRGTTAAIGYHVTGMLETRTGLPPLRLRVEALHAEWGGDGIPSASAATASVLFAPIRAPRVAPYLLAGIGWYTGPGDGVRAGWTLGAGVRLPGLTSIVLESRIHTYKGTGGPYGKRVPYDTNPQRIIFLPISVAIQW